MYLQVEKLDKKKRLQTFDVEYSVRIKMALENYIKKYISVVGGEMGG